MRPVRLAIATALLATAAVGAGAAAAYSLEDLADPGYARIYGEYAPRGDCSAGPKLTIDATGLTFTNAGNSLHPPRFEHALTYFGPEYEGRSMAVFPFPIDDNDLGRVIMFIDADEVAGQIAIHDNLGPGQRYNAMEAALVAASPLLRCGGVPEPAPTPALWVKPRN